MKIHEAKFIKSAAGEKDYPRDNLPEVAFAGRSNVGKSSLINRLVNRKGLAKTSSTPGKTQLINFFAINEKFYLVDLPGYGYAKVSKSMRKDWKSLVENYLSNRESLLLVVLILDIRREPNSGDISLLDWLNYYQIPSLIVLTKTDKISRSQIHKQSRMIKNFLHLEEDRVLPFSALTKEGKDKILSKIGEEISKNYLRG